MTFREELAAQLSKARITDLARIYFVGLVLDTDWTLRPKRFEAS